MAHRPNNPGQWPAMMRASTAAAYVDEVSVEAFRAAVGTVYPEPIKVARKGERWLKEDLDDAILRMAGRGRRAAQIFDAASVLSRRDS